MSADDVLTNLLAECERLANACKRAAVVNTSTAQLNRLRGQGQAYADIASRIHKAMAHDDD